MGIETIVALGVAAVAVFYLIGVFNKLVVLKNSHLNAFAQIEVQLKRRYDLIPNLVETAKGYLKHESQTLENVIAARNTASAQLGKAKADPTNQAAIAGLNQAEGGLMRALNGFNLTVEAYPELKANTHMIALHEELSSTENKIAFARQAFNDFVTRYNTYRQTFPINLVAGIFGHTHDAALLEFEDKAAIGQPVKVSF